MSEGCGQILHSFFVIEWKRRKGTDVEKVTGYVEHIVFRNEENGYTVFHLENEDGEVTCVGNLNFITSRLCSITITVFPSSVSLRNISVSL